MTTMSHRIWWLVSFCALAIGAAIEFDLNPTAPQAAAQADPPAAVAARKSASPGG
jgi:hypothetical protein